MYISRAPHPVLILPFFTIDVLVVRLLLPFEWLLWGVCVSVPVLYFLLWEAPDLAGRARWGRRRAEMRVMTER